MTACGRWIRLGDVEAGELFAASTVLAAGPGWHPAPTVLWARAQGPLCLGSGSAAGGDLVWAETGSQLYVLTVPRRMAPGRATRWLPWFLAPAVATCRALGAPACLDGAAIRLHGRVIIEGTASLTGDCIVMAASFPCGLVPWLGVEAVIEETLRLRLEAQHGWQFEHAWPDASERESIRRASAALRESAGLTSTAER